MHTCFSYLHHLQQNVEICKVFYLYISCYVMLFMSTWKQYFNINIILRFCVNPSRHWSDINVVYLFFIWKHYLKSFYSFDAAFQIPWLIYDLFGFNWISSFDWRTFFKFKDEPWGCLLKRSCDIFIINKVDHYFTVGLH